MTSSDTIDSALTSVRAALSRDLMEIVPLISPSDLTDRELAAMYALLRPVHERLLAGERPAATVLKLVKHRAK